MRTGERIAIRIWLFEDEHVLATADVDGEIAALTAPAVVLGHAAAAVSRRGHVLGSRALELGTTEPPGSLLC